MGIEQEAIGHIILPTNGAIAQPNLFVNVRQRLLFTIYRQKIRSMLKAWTLDTLTNRLVYEAKERSL